MAKQIDLETINFSDTKFDSIFLVEIESLDTSVNTKSNKTEVKVVNAEKEVTKGFLQACGDINEQGYSDSLKLTVKGLKVGDTIKQVVF
jgi:hypothetical protein